MSHPPYTVDGEAICSLLHYCWDFPGSSVGKESACNAADPVLIAGSESSPGEGTGYPLQYSCLEYPYEQRSLASYSPWGHKELDMTERVSTQTSLPLGS